MGDQRCGVDLALFDEPQDLVVVAAVDAAGFEGEVFAVHVGEGKGLGFVVEGHHGDDGVGPGAGPGQTEGVRCAICCSWISGTTCSNCVIVMKKDSR